MPLTINQRAEWVFEQAQFCLLQRLSGGVLNVQNEASLQLQFASILKVLGDVAVCKQSERFSIELEKNVINSDALFQKSGSRRAKIDIWFSLEDHQEELSHRVAIELKFFKRTNHREPNNRADYFKDLLNLENYTEHADGCRMLLITDHTHYVDQGAYEHTARDFDFRDGREYRAGTELQYRAENPYCSPITLDQDYRFIWDRLENNLFALPIKVSPMEA